MSKLTSFIALICLLIEGLLTPLAAQSTATPTILCPASPSAELHYFTRYEVPQVSTLAIQPGSGVVTPTLNRQSGLYRYDLDQDAILPFIEDDNFISEFFSWSDDGSQIATVVRESGKMGIWDAASGERIITFDEQNSEATRNPNISADELGGAQEWYYFDVAWSPDSKYLAAIGTEPLRVWDVEQRQLVFAPDIHGTPAQINYRQQFSDYLAWSPDSQLLALAEHNLIHVWDTSTWQEIHTLTSPFDAIYMLAWAANGSLAAIGGGSPLRLTAWDTQSWEQTDTFANSIPDRPGQSSLHSLAWSPDNCWLAIGASGSQVFILNAADGTIAQTLGGDQIEDLSEVEIQLLSANKLVWSLDGTHIFATIDGTISE